MKDNISPEEKLSRLTRGQKKPDIAADKKNATGIAGLKQAINPSATVGTDLKQGRRVSYSVYLLMQKCLSFLNIWRIIKIVFVASCLYLIIAFIYPWVGLREIKLPQIITENVSASNTELRQEVKPFEFYLQGIKGRQIFSSPIVQETERPPSNVNIDLIKDMTLVGVISGENLQAVVEDRKTHKTYYVTKGQFIGQFQVEDIEEGKIILNYNGQRLELYL